MRKKDKAPRTEKERLQLFLHRANQLKNATLVKDPLTPTITADLIQPNEKDDLFGTKPIPEDPLAALVLAFRHFISNNEDVQVYKILKLCQQSEIDVDLKIRLRGLREEWQGALQGGEQAVIVNNQVITGDEALDLWLNGEYYHSDPKHVERIASFAPEEKMLIRYKFSAVLALAPPVIFKLAEVIAEVLKQPPFDADSPE